jgi:hypothetical protein
MFLDHLVLRDFGHYGIIFTNMCVVITFTMVNLFRELISVNDLCKSKK